MIYSSISLLLFFNFLVIQRSESNAAILQRLYFSNFVRRERKLKMILVIGKEPLTLEKDKIDQSKYRLSCLKPPVTDMKWKNRDIDVIEWANSPKFPFY